MAVGKPSSGPSWTRSVQKLTIKSATASGAKVYIYQSRWRDPGGSWSDWTSADWPFGGMDGRSAVVTNYAPPGRIYGARTRGGLQSAYVWEQLGPWSDITTFTMPNVPDPLPSVTIAKVSDTSLKATWGSTSNGGTKLTGYRIRLYRNGVLDTTKEQGVTQQITFTGLTPGATYSVRVSAGNELGYSDETSSANLVLATVPSQIETVNLTREGVASWAAPANGDSAIIEYFVEVWDGYGWRPTVSNGKLLTYTVPDRRPGIGYKVRVRARNAVGVAAWRESAYVTPSGCTCTA